MRAPFRSGARALRLPALVAALLVLSQGTATPTASAADYPPKPSGVTVTVSSSRVNVGACVNLFGDGFKPSTRARITDNGVFVAVVLADANKHFTRQVCFTSSATHGRHTLAAAGTDANGFAASGSAVVTVLGVTVSNPPPGTGGGNGNGGGTGGGTGSTGGGTTGGNGSTTTGNTGVTTPPSTGPTTPAQTTGGVVPPGSGPVASAPGTGGGNGWMLPAALAVFGFLALLLLFAMFMRRRPEGQQP